MLDIDGRIEISMCLIAAHLTAKRLLIRSVGSIGIMTDTAFLGGVGTLHSGCSHPPFGRIPGDLRALMLGKTLVDRPVDLLTDVAGKTLPARAAG